MEGYNKKRAFKEKFRKFFKVLFKLKKVRLAAFGLLIFILLAVFAPYLAPYDPNVNNMYSVNQGMSPEHLLGTDALGRDVLSRLIHGSRVSLLVGVFAVIIAAGIGIFLGLCSAYFGGWVDAVIMRAVEVMLCIPPVVLALSFILLLGSGLTNLAIILGISTVPGYIRMMRGQALSVKKADYIAASQTLGSKDFYLMYKHILPNSISPLIVMMTQQIGFTIMMEAGLSFLGIGITVPTASWGTMINAGRAYLLINPVISIAPGLAVVLLVICLNFLGDGLRDALDPRLRGEA